MDPMPTPEQPNEAHHPQRRLKRRLMGAVVALYALSLAAACVLVLRGQPLSQQTGRKGDKSPGLLASLSESKDMVGWISIHGPIFSSESGKPWERGSEMWARKIKQMADTKGVRAIVLDINSPGGSVGAVQELYSQILRVRKEKRIPVVALFGDVAASGGYYIAAACDKIVAHPGTLTGSIGVIFSVTNMQGLFQKVGFKMDPIKSGKHKDIGSPARQMTAEERELMQALIDDAYGQFVGAVAAGRKLPVETVKPLADGRIFSGTQALQARLVDQLGDSTDAIELAGQLGGIQGRPKVKRDSDRFSEFFGMMDSKLSGGGTTALLGELKPHSGLQFMWSAGW
jgi:protease IV